MSNLDLLLQQEVTSARTFEENLQNAVSTKSARVTQKYPELKPMFYCRNKIIEMDKYDKIQCLDMLVMSKNFNCKILPHYEFYKKKLINNLILA